MADGCAKAAAFRMMRTPYEMPDSGKREDVEMDIYLSMGLR